VSRRWAVLATVVLVWSLVGCASKPPTTGVEDTKGLRVLQARAAYDRGVQQIQMGQTAAAILSFREAVALDDAKPQYHDALGVALLQGGRADLALGEFDRAMTLDPNFAEAIFHKGLTLSDGLQRWSDALPVLQRALAMPTLQHPQAGWQALGVTLLNLGHLTDAEAALRFAINLDPEMSSAYYNLGLVLVRANRREEARAAFRRTRELAPESTFGQAAGERLRALGDGG
jgi:Flp pilus assembly protein TadD